jgi:DnaJ-class molecular chaperone
MVTVNITVPSKLTDKQKDLLKQFKQIEDEKKKGFFKF